MGMGGKSFVIAEFQIACISTNMAPRSPFDKQRRLLSDRKSITPRPEEQSDVEDVCQRSEMNVCHLSKSSREYIVVLRTI